MPKSPTQGIDHSASTDHAILRTPASKRQSAQGLRPWWNSQAELTRETALAHAVLKSPDAIASLRAALDKFPSDKRLNLQLAQLLPPSEAQSFYERALPLPAAAVNVGIAKAEAKLFEQAINHWRDALRLEPANSAARLNLVQSLIRTGEIAAALRELETLLRYDPDRLDLQRLAAQLKARLSPP
jgi:tetratricopeptide (TPR) repeat protein